jgi:hypothetical protein
LTVLLTSVGVYRMLARRGPRLIRRGAASLVPVLRASRIDPVEALRWA